MLTNNNIFVILKLGLKIKASRPHQLIFCYIILAIPAEVPVKTGVNIVIN
jgi:hypothetical protein